MSKKFNLLSCVWELTLSCNLNCIHCGSTAGKKRDNELNLDESFNLCEDLKKTGCRSVALMGGEPLIHKNFWSIAEKIRELNMNLCIITNGTVYDDTTFKKLKSLSPEAVATSLDGASEETHDKIRGVNGSFKKTTNFINRALKEGLPVSVITTVSKLNISELNGLKDFIKGKKIAWQIQTAGAEGERFPAAYLLDENEFYSVGLFIEMLRNNYDISDMPVIGAHDMGYNSCVIKHTALYEKWQGCQAGMSVVGIRSNGDVLGCLSLNNEKFIEGNLRNRSLYEIWNDENSFSYNRTDLKKPGKSCSGCKYFSDCGGGCMEMSFMKTGELHNDPYCFYRIEKKLFNPIKRYFLSFRSSFSGHSRERLEFLNKFFGGTRK